MPEPINIVDLIDSYVDEFTSNIEPIQKSLYNKVSALIKDLSLNDDGTIKQTASNSQIIKKVEIELKNVVYSPKYQKNVAGLRLYLQDILNKQKAYFKAVDSEFLHPAVSDELLKQSFNNAVNTLTETGLQSNVAAKTADIVSKGIREGASYGDMADQLRTFMIGDKEDYGKLVGYSRGIVTDLLHGSSRNYNALMTKKLKLSWFSYAGSLVKNKTSESGKKYGGSREWCIALVKKRWIHESELPAICRGEIDGKTVSLQGLMPGTNSENVIHRCGGYNCQHSMTPVPDENVPTKLRRKFDETVQPDDEEKAVSRPRRKRK